MASIKLLIIIIALTLTDRFDDNGPWYEFNKLGKYRLSGKKITFVHGCLLCGNSKLTRKGGIASFLFALSLIFTGH
jgi:hypothetical protein